MARVLHIRATVRGERSYSLRAAQAFLERYAETHPEDVVDTLDLLNDPVPEFGAFEAGAKYRILHGQNATPEEEEAWRAVEGAIRRFKGADKLVVSSPMWNFSIPYRLKQYIDVIVQPGYTFDFSPDEGYEGLVTGRPAVLFLARGGAYRPGTPEADYDFQRPYLEAILGFMGFTEVSTLAVEPTEHEGPEVAEQKLAQAIERARQMAPSF